ncbi:MAG: CRISPR-associated endonuclease Cas2 [Gammaproteobacteria bacterium]
MISYDIADPRRLRRVAEILEGHGERVLWSVFECTLDNAALDTLRARIGAEIDAVEDSVRWYPVCAWCGDRIEWQGTSAAVADPAYFIV